MIAAVETRPVTLDLAVDEILTLHARASYLAKAARCCEHESEVDAQAKRWDEIATTLIGYIHPVVDEAADDTVWRFK